MKIKAISLLVALAMLVVSVPASVASDSKALAEDTVNQSQFSGKSDFDFYQIDDWSNIEYTYVECGKKYLVRERVSDALSFVETSIFEVLDEDMLLVNSVTTAVTVENDIMMVEQNINGVITTQYNDLRAGELELQPQPESNRYNYSEKGLLSCDDCIELNDPGVMRVYPPSTGHYEGGVTYCPQHNTYWTMWFDSEYTDYGSNWFQILTIGIVISVITALIAKVSPIAATAISFIASYCVSMNVTTAYWTRTSDELWEISKTGVFYNGTPCGVRAYTSFYTNSARTPQYKIGDTITAEFWYYYLSCPLGHI